MRLRPVKEPIGAKRTKRRESSEAATDKILVQNLGAEEKNHPESHLHHDFAPDMTLAKTPALAQGMARPGVHNAALHEPVTLMNLAVPKRPERFGAKIGSLMETVAEAVPPRG